MSSSNRTDQLGRYLMGSPLKILVGQDKRQYFVHPDILLSFKESALASSAKEVWKTSGDGAIDWTDFDHDTIERVLTFLYTSDYHLPLPDADDVPHPEQGMNGETPGVDVSVSSGLEPSQQENTPPEDQEQMPEQPDNLLKDHTEATLDSLERPLTPISRCLSAGLPEQHRQTAAGALSETNLQGSNYQFGLAILAHAKVYTFAHLHFVSELERLALQYLTQALTLVNCKRSRLTPYLEDAIRHIYENTPSGGEGRKLLSQFVAINYTDLFPRELENLVSEGGDFMVDLSHKVGRRLKVSVDRGKSLAQEIDGLETEVKAWKDRCTDKETGIRRMQHELREWENWNRGAGKKERRRSGFSSSNEAPDASPLPDQYPEVFLGD